jgi:hypothetical protein
VRPRELWFWLGAAFLTIGAVLTAVAVAFYTKEPHYPLGTGPQMVLAYMSFVLAFLCFMAAIVGWRPWLRWQRFPDLTVHVDAMGYESVNRTVVSVGMPSALVTPTTILTLKVHYTNAEGDRSASIRAAYLLAKAKTGSVWPHEVLFTEPSWPVSRSRQTEALQLPVNLSPQVGAGGELVFDLDPFLAADVAEPFDGRIEIHDAVSGKVACFPAAVGTFRRHRGLRPTTIAERVNGLKQAQPWYGLLGPPDPDRSDQ